MLAGCKETNHKNDYINDAGAELSKGTKQTNITEYIIVLKENTRAEDALNTLQKYNARLIRDLKRNRYLIGLENDPGIDQLKLDTDNSKDIKHIQPNYRYEIQ